jgi:hypothetical protein
MSIQVKTNIRLTTEANIRRSLTWELEIERRVQIAVKIAQAVRAQALKKIGSKKIKCITIVRYAPRAVNEKNICKSLEVIKMTLHHLLMIDDKTKCIVKQKTGVGTNFQTLVEIDLEDELSA